MKVFGIIGWKNAGKTSLMERLVAEIVARGFTVSTVKHVHHNVDLDQPGKDTYRHRAAGAREVVLASADRFALMREHRGSEPALGEVLARLAPVDLVLVEGYKRDRHAKIEVYRAAAGQPLIQPGDPTVAGVATDTAVGALSVPVLDLNDTGAVADFVLRQTGLALRPLFDTVLVADWSASASPSATPGPNAIWVGLAQGKAVSARHFPTRATAEAFLVATIRAERQAGRRVLVGFDFAFGYPQGFARHLTSSDDPRAVWAWLDAHLQDTANNANTRFALAASMNRRFPDDGPFWGSDREGTHDGLPYRKPAWSARHGLAERRRVDQAVPGAKSVWQLTGAGAVGSQSLVGLPMIHRLCQQFGAKVWPFDAPEGKVVLAEVYPSLLRDAVRAQMAAGWVADAAQVRLLALALWRLAQTGDLAVLLRQPDEPLAAEEGWILGAGHADALRLALKDPAP